MKDNILFFREIALADVPKVGGKNASLGEMFQKLTPKGILVPDGFATTSKVYRDFLNENGLSQKLKQILAELDVKDFSNLTEVGAKARALLNSGDFHYNVQVQIIAAYRELLDDVGMDCSVAVRSSATAEDLPEASFAGQQESYLNVKGEEALLEACKNCFISLFTDRAIKYRVDMGFDHMDVALSVGVQQMVRSDKACAGVGFTLEPDTGFRDVVVLSAAWGLGEHVVKGRIEPDEFVVFKPSLKKGKRSIISKKLGSKESMLIYASDDESGESTVSTDTASDLQKQFTLSDDEIETLAKWAVQIEEHYKMPMDIEWAKDGENGKLYIVQARPETIHATKKGSTFSIFRLKEKGERLVSGIGLGNKITSGKARLLNSPEEAHKLQEGEVLVTDTTDPDWDPILKKVAAVVTNKGGRTSHAAIVARELGAVAIVGAGDATAVIKDGQEVTISCAEGNTGYVYDGFLEWEEKEIDISKIKLPQTAAMIILGDPDKAFHLANLPNNGIGLMRLEFIINNAIQIHPMALVQYDQLESEEVKQKIDELTFLYDDKQQYFVDKLAEAVGTIAAAFYPKEVIVRMSDFKSNEYANLIGGKAFEPSEENPMLGFRGASRYYHERYREGFRLECEAMSVVRNEMGLSNVKLMIPFCRTVEEGKKVLDLMASFGLKQGENDLEVYVMIEIPSNVILADEFAKLFDGFSIGTNDLTQLTLGLDRDNALINELFDENNPAIKEMIRKAVTAAKENGIKIGLCGQAPSDFPQFAQFLVREGIDSISFNADALIQGIKNILVAEGNPKLLEKELHSGWDWVA